MTRPDHFRITTLHGSELSGVLEALASLRIRVFREFPYLYAGSLEYEKAYLQTYIDCPQSIAVLAWNGDELIGASTGLPMPAEVAEFQAPFVEAGYELSELFYCAESVLLPEYRGQGIYREFFQRREQHASECGATSAVFCVVVRPHDHPLRPAGYQPLDSVWSYFGYSPMAGFTTEFSWQDVDETAETSKTMQFYGKSLQR